MKYITFNIRTLWFCVPLVLSVGLTEVQAGPPKPTKFPYKKAGLSETEAAAHLLARFTYGAKPGQVKEVIEMGLENWFMQQLQATMPDDSLQKRLLPYKDIRLTNSEVCAKYPPGFVVRTMAIKDSVISKDSVDKAINKKAFNDTMLAYMKRKGIANDQELYKQFINQNILRAAYSTNQLQEVLTDFWFNHFNVSFTKSESAQFIPGFERDVVRPNVFGNFDKLLLATAKSPAMLYFLDNFTSVGPPGPAKPLAPLPGKMVNTGGMQTAMESSMEMQVMNMPKPSINKATAGLNENYAREVMELHTLGVDGGYNQQDVTQAARILTGWTIYPVSEQSYGSAMKGLVDKIGINNLEAKGYVRDGDFLFTPGRHDGGEKTVLGHLFPAGGGYREGVDMLELLAHHPSTAKFISRKIAIRFVSDTPPESLIKKMAKTFTEKNGNISEVLLTMVNSREFWGKKTLRGKTKSPFELAISAVRAVNADIVDPYQLYSWITRMGQKTYYYQAPTGFPDRAQYWINTGSLLNRMNFGLALAQQRIPGVKSDLTLLGVPENGSAELALVTFSEQLMPGRKLDATYTKLTPLLADPGLYAKVSNSTAKTVTPAPDNPVAGAPGDMMMMNAAKENRNLTINKEADGKSIRGTNAMVAQVIGIIIGSPEFQRR